MGGGKNPGAANERPRGREHHKGTEQNQTSKKAEMHQRAKVLQQEIGCEWGMWEIRSWGNKQVGARKEEENEGGGHKRDLKQEGMRKKKRRGSTSQSIEKVRVDKEPLSRKKRGDGQKELRAGLEKGSLHRVQEESGTTHWWEEGSG